MCPQVAPATSRLCNQFPCLDTLPLWRVGSWGPCSAAETPVDGGCGTTAGTQTRTVECVTPGGAPLPEQACASHGSKPGGSEPCVIDATCACDTAADCPLPDGHWMCNSTSHTCTCSPLWGGALCDARLLPASSPCTEGVVDVLGTCCQGYIDAVTAVCCPGLQDVDALGRCCPTQVDACGACGGSGVVVDVQGTCCHTALPPSGVCCVGAVVDSCGVCGGVNSCGYVAGACLLCACSACMVVGQSLVCLCDAEGCVCEGRHWALGPTRSSRAVCMTCISSGWM